MLFNLRLNIYFRYGLFHFHGMLFDIWLARLLTVFLYAMRNVVSICVQHTPD